MAQWSKLCEVNNEQTILGTARGLDIIFLNSNLSSDKKLIGGLPLWFKRGGKEHDRALWAIQGVRVDAVVKIVRSE